MTIVACVANCLSVLERTSERRSREGNRAGEEKAHQIPASNAGYDHRKYMLKLICPLIELHSRSLLVKMRESTPAPLPVKEYQTHRHSLANDSTQA